MFLFFASASALYALTSLHYLNTPRYSFFVKLSACTIVSFPVLLFYLYSNNPLFPCFPTFLPLFAVDISEVGFFLVFNIHLILKYLLLLK